ncbi:T9SS type A sorting domain-containing protein, partial [Flavobacterium sp. NRK F10]|uniref:virginiamycin B lyase family protein n=1 Tax=Flavobacterium sp. NRK F10 TaxID=2954931 RepID=UPI0020916A59
MKQKYFYSILLFFISFFGFSQTLDQENAPLSFSGVSFNVSSTEGVGQSFTAGMTGDLSQINIRVGNSGVFVAGDFQLRIIDGNGYGGTVLNTTTFSIATAPATNNYDELEIVLSSVVPITSGNMYTIDLRGTSGSVGVQGTGNGIGPDYTNGLFYLSEFPFNFYSLWFKTFVNLPTPATHLNFDGVDDYITLSNESNFDFTNQMTVEFWVNSNVMPEQWDALVVKGDNSWRVALTSTGTVAFTGTNAFADFFSTSSVTDGNWHHVAVTYDGTFAKIYIDGSLESQLAGTANINNSGYAVSIGKNLQMSGRNYTGNMDEVRIWNTARTIDQINASKNCELQGNETGLVAYYQFNQGFDQANNAGLTTLNDITTNANNGTLSNFALNGAISNWLAGSPVTTGSTIPAAPTAMTPVTYTQGDTASPLTATTGGTDLLWYTSATGGTGSTTAPTPSTATVGSTSYWVSSTNSNGCESDRVEIVVTVNAASTSTAAPTTTWTTQVYTGDDKTIADIQVTGSTITWYDSPTGGMVLPTTTLLVDQTIYYASQTVGGVESTYRLAVTVKRISDNTQTLPPASTVANLVTTPSAGATAQWFANATGGTALASTDVLTNGVYYVEQQTVTTIENLGSGFNNPYGVAIQADGKIVIADRGNNAIKRMDADGTNIETLGSGFSYPAGVAIQVDGKIVVADPGNNAIKRMDADGTNIVTLGSGFNAPFGVAIQADGKIVVANYGDNTIKRMDANGTNMVTLGSGFDSPRGVTIQVDGKIVVADSYNNAIKRMDSDGTNIEILGSGFVIPVGVAIQADGKIVVVDTYNDAITRMDSDGTNMVTLGSGLNSPFGVAIQTDSKIVVADYGNSVIKRITEASISNRVPVNVAISSPAAPTTTWTTQVYTGDDKTIADIQVTGSTITWYDSPTGGMVLAPTISLLDNGTAYASQTVGGVESTDRLAVTVKRISDNTQTLPPASTVADLVTTPSTGTTAQWFANATGGTALAGTDVLTNGVYYVEQQTVTSVETLGSGFSAPYGVAIQADGKIVVADAGNGVIKRMDADGTNMVTLASGFNLAFGVVIQTDGKIVVADAYNNAIKRMDADGTNMVTLGSGFSQPAGVAIQTDGKIVVADVGNGTIKRMDADGTNMVALGSGFNFPYGVAIQADGKIVVADSGNGAIKRMNADGTNIVTLASGFSNPSGVAIQADGKIVVADTFDTVIKRMDADGTNMVTLGSGFLGPYGVAIQTDGKIVVADTNNNAIKRITEASTSNRVPVNVAISSPAAPTTTWTTQVYTGDDKTIADIQVTGSTITWYDSPSGGMVLAPTISLLDNGTAYASQTVGGVESTDRLAVTVKRISDNTQTLPPTSTVADLVTTPSTGATAQWFANATGGTALPGTDVLANGVYYVEQQTATGIETLGSGFNYPSGVAIQTDGKIVAVDSGNNTVKRMDFDGNNIETLGSGFNNPTGVAIQSDGKIVVADKFNDAIKRMDSDASNIVTLGSGFNGPSGVAIQTDGKIVVADTFNNAIKRMDSDGGNIEVLGSGFSSPTGVAIQADGKIIIAGFGNSTIKRMDSDGSNIETLGSGFSMPFGVTIQSDGKIVVADYGNNAIKRMNADGSNIEILAYGAYSYPNGVTIQADGKIVVADSGNNAIKRITEASASNRVPVNVDVTTLSTSNFDVNSFKIYPNPSTGIFTINTKEEVQIEVFDLVGKMIKKENIHIGVNSIDVTNYANGVYLLKVNNSGKVNSYRII